MSLPKSCEIYPRHELACQQFEFFREAKTTLQNGGFIIYDDRFWTFIGMAPAIEIISENTTYPFAHEAGVYTPSTGNIFVTSSLVQTAGKKKIQITKIVRNETGSYSCEEIEPGISMANGGVNYKDGVLFCEQGTLTEPGGLVYMEAVSPYRTEMVVSNYHGRWFNSVNDVVVHSDGSIWFTDPAYGFEQDIRLRPQLPNHIYRYDPTDGDIRVVADGIGKPNGLCFSPDEKTLYITDTDGLNGKGIYEPSRASSIYAYDITCRHESAFLTHKRLFAMADVGIPDGIKCDTSVNVYSGCGDGVHVWTPGGKLIGKIYVPGGCPNFCFGEKGEVFLLNGHKIWRAQLHGGVRGALLNI